MPLPTPTLDPIIIYFNLRDILPTGKTSPARDDLDLPAATEIFAFPPLLLSTRFATVLVL
jgi:hypothetical protein